MPKLILLLLALVAVQNSDGASLPKFTEMQEVLLQFVEAAKDIDKIISYIGDHISTLATDYEFKVNDIIDKQPTHRILNKLKKSISKLESGSSNQVKHCFVEAKQSTSEATNFYTTGLNSCASDAHSSATHINGVVKVIEDRSINIQNRIAEGLSKCLKKHSDDVQCLRNIIEPLKQEIADAKEEVEKAHEHVQDDAVNAIRNLNICLQHLKNDVVYKSDEILVKLEECIKAK